MRLFFIIFFFWPTSSVLARKAQPIFINNKPPVQITYNEKAVKEVKEHIQTIFKICEKKSTSKKQVLSLIRGLRKTLLRHKKTSTLRSQDRLYISSIESSLPRKYQYENSLELFLETFERKYRVQYNLGDNVSVKQITESWFRKIYDGVICHTSLGKK